MKKNANKKAIVRNSEDAETSRDICGMIKQITTAEDFAEASIAIAMIKSPTQPHYHERSAEFHYVLEGSGRIAIGYRDFEIKKGTTIVIPPNLAHFTIPHEKMEVIVFSAIRAWERRDQIVLNENNEDVSFSVFKERLELIDEYFSRNGLNFGENTTRPQRKEIEQTRRKLVSQNKMDSIPIITLREMLAVNQ